MADEQKRIGFGTDIIWKTFLVFLIINPESLLADSEEEYSDAWLDEAIFGDSEEKSKSWISSWNGEIYLSGGYGYRENVLLGEIAPEDSGFSFLGVEALALRKTPDSRDEWLVLLLAENRNFADVTDFENETLAFAQVGYGRNLGDFGTVGGTAEYLFSKQAFDTSIDEIENSSAVVEGQQGVVSLTWDGTLLGDESSIKVGAGEMAFNANGNDYDLLDVEYVEVFTFGEKSALSFKLKSTQRDYVDRLPRDNEGFRIEDSSLALDIHRGRLTWDREGTLFGGESDTRLFIDFARQTSIASDYFDRETAKLGFQFRWSGESWDLSFTTAYIESSYDVRKTSLGEIRADDDWSWSIELERHLSKEWEVYLALYGSEKTTNEALASFQTNSVVVGLRAPPIRLF